MDESKPTIFRMNGRILGFQVLLLMTVVAPVTSQPGFLSIDCGSEQDYWYPDEETGIYWETDAKYISTGTNAQGITVPSTNYSTIVNERQVSSLRYFDDEAQSRDCYALDVTAKATYLLRLTFFYGDWRISYPCSFTVYINATRWGSLEFSSDDYDNWNTTHEYEAIVYSPGTKLNVCLVRTRAGSVAFISSLELRQLLAGMYSAVVGTYKFLYRWRRYNYGPELGSRGLRYPVDAYDRIWSVPGSFANSTSIATRSNLTSSRSTPERPPAEVMKDAGIYYNSDIFWYYFRPLVQGRSLAAYSYFQEVDGNASASNIRGIDYYVNDIKIGTFNVSDEAQEISSSVLQIPESDVNISFVRAPWSKLPPMINAIEVYYVYDLILSETAIEDVISLAGLKSTLNLTNWTGDPCFPVPFDWLNCTANLSESSPSNQMSDGINSQLQISISRVTSLFFASKLTTRIIPQEITYLTALTHLDLSSNDLGSTNFPAGLRDLRNLRNLTVLDVSNNNISGNIMDFVNAVNFDGLREMNAANNFLDGSFSIDPLAGPLQGLEIAKFDGNKINGILDLSGWYNSLRSATAGGPGVPSARQLFSLTNNNIVGIHPGVDILTSTIEDVFFNYSNPDWASTAMNRGILLGGNPWCQQTENENVSRTSVESFFCRLDPTDRINENNTSGSSSNRKLAIIVGVSVGGACALLFCCFCFPILWHLRKKSSALRDIQEALTKEKVHPRFYYYGDLRAATNDFSSENKLGEGAFGAVYRGRLEDGNLIAVKKLFPSKQALTEFLNEAVLITGIKHRNLIQLNGCCIRENQRMLVYEYAENGNLAEALWGQGNIGEAGQQHGNTLDWPKRFNICVGIARGLSYLHEELQPRIIHRDIKPANILIDTTFNAKIADFGLARSFLEGQSQADYTNLAGTTGYLSPEYVIEGQLTERADVYSFGVVLLEIVSGRKCINRQLPAEKVLLLSWARHLREKGMQLDLLDPAIQGRSEEVEVTRVIDIAFLCVQMDPTKRPAMSHVVAMLQGVNDVTLKEQLESNELLANTPSNSSKFSRALDPSLTGEYYGMDLDSTNMAFSTTSNTGSKQIADVSAR